MKVNIKNRRKWIIGGAALLLTATPSFALFGFGDIVFDPTTRTTGCRLQSSASPASWGKTLQPRIRS